MDSCTEFGFNYDGAPASHPTISSRFVTPAWNEVRVHSRALIFSTLKNTPFLQRQCGYRFPGASGASAAVVSPNAAGLNSAYQGWNTTTERLIFANGMRKSSFNHP